MSLLSHELQPTISERDLEIKFHELKSGAVEGIRVISEVYLDLTTESLIYRPITHLEIDEILKGRQRILSDSSIQLSGIEIALETVTDRDPYNRRRTGAFRVVKWYNAGFEPSIAPKSVSQRKIILDKKSGWQRGGPK